jgi:hypothetical protein
MSGLGCLTSVLAFIIGVVLYPRAKWLFVLPLVGIFLLVLAILTRKGATRTEVADRAEALLNGNSAGSDVDDYEHLNPKPKRLKDLWRKTITIGGLPEEWTRLDDQRKSALRDIIAEIRRSEPPPA